MSQWEEGRLSLGEGERVQGEDWSDRCRREDGRLE